MKHIRETIAKYFGLWKKIMGELWQKTWGKLCHRPWQKKLIESFLISLLLAFIVCFLHTVLNNRYDFREIGALAGGNTYYNKHITPVNYLVEGNRYTAGSDDAILLFPDINKTVVNIVVNYDEPLEDYTLMYLYYDTDGTGFSEDKEITILASKGDKNAEFILDQHVKTIRIDIGNKSGDTFCLKNVKTNCINWAKTDFWLYFSLLFIISLLIAFRDTAFVGGLYQNRYWVGLGCLILCMLFSLHGSSINGWGYVTGYQYYEDFPKELFGTWRVMRGDEYGLLTPLAFAQAQNEFGYVSDLFGSYGMDMFMVYGQAVKDISVIFRPFYLGYLLLGVEKGLSFFWSARLIFLFLVSWDFGCLILDKRQKKTDLACLYAMLLTLSPLIQWWFAINGLVEMLIFGQLAILLFVRYLQEEKWWKRSLCIVSICYLACCYILLLYPAWQIPLAWIFVFVIIALVLDLILAKKAHWYWKDLFSWLGSIGVFGALLVRVLMKSAETIQAILNSEYPGNRTFYGKGEWQYLLSGWSNLFLTQVSDSMNAENSICEEVGFLDFMPIGFLLALFIIGRQIYKKQKKDVLLIMLCLFTLIFGSWYLVGWPQSLCRVTLMYTVNPERGRIAIQLAQLLLLLRAVSYVNKEEIQTKVSKVNPENMKMRISKRNPKTIPQILSVIMILVVGIGCYFANVTFYPWIYTNFLKTLLLVSLLGIIYLVLSDRLCFEKKYIWPLVSAFLMFSTMLVNPIVSGVDAWKDNQLLQAVERNNGEQDVWITDGCSVYVANLLPTVGAQTVNAIQLYPDVETWEVLDPNGENRWIYNRYAHVTLDLVSDQTRFDFIQNDWFHVNVTPKDLKKMGVTKFLSTNTVGYEDFHSDGIQIEQVEVIGNYSIYEIK